MFIDAASLTSPATLEADVVIVGAGPAGIALATALAPHVQRVLLVVGGDLASSDAFPPTATLEGYLRPGHLQGHALRGFGGTSAVWTGACATLDPLSFEARDDLQVGRWPIARSTLQPWWRAAQPWLDLDDRAEALDPWRLPGLDGVIAKPVHQSSPTTRFSAHVERLRADPVIHVVHGASATEILTPPGGEEARGVTIVNAAGTTHTALGRVTVLAAGGVGCPRLLLASRRHDARGVGNPHDVVGRYFGEHPYIDNAGISVRLSGEVASALDEPLSPDGHRCLQFTAELLRGEHLLQTCFNLIELPTAQQPFFALDAALMRGGVQGYTATIQQQMEARPDNRIVLSEQTDSTGLPIAHAILTLSDADKRSAIRSLRVLGDQLLEAGCGRVSRPPTDPDALKFGGSGHLMGATRMGTDPTTSVVDPNAKVHSVQGLYVCSAAVFPTFGCSNPTWTVVALALRLADHLKKVLG